MNSDFDETVIVGEYSEGSRKRVKNNRNLHIRRKEARHHDPDPALLTFDPPCTHETQRYSCNKIPITDLVIARQKVYRVWSKVEQDRLLSYMIKASPPKRRRPVYRPQTKSRNPKKLSIKYFINTRQGSHKPVCGKFFQKLFRISQTRINNIAKSVLNGDGIQERRGGNHKAHLFEHKKVAVVNFISKLRGYESHYNRKKSKRIYLPSNLSINKLFKMYNDQATEDVKVKRTFFSKIFCTKFNIGFGTPAVDVCSYCLKIKTAMKAETNIQKKTSLMHCLGAHKLRAKTFHKIMKKSPPECVTLCFDLQQIHPLPKLNISEAYYSRQINFYTFCITDLSNKKTNFFTWNETQSGKGSVQVSSVLLSFLQSYHFDISKTCLRLFCDGCGGQNKNMHIVHALSWWLFAKAPAHLQKIVLYYPVRGHSYMPPDRAFGVVEKELKRQEEIITQDEYTLIYSKVGKVCVLGIDWKILDVKGLSEMMKRMDGIMDAKRIYINKQIIRNKRTAQTKSRINVKMENFYIADTGKNYATIMKKGFCIENVSEPPVIDASSNLIDAKKKDLNMLLTKRFGDEWRNNENLSYYKYVIDECPESVDCGQGENEEMCDCLEHEDESSQF